MVHYPIVRIDGYTLKANDQILDYMSRSRLHKVLSVLPTSWRTLAEINIMGSRVHYKSKVTDGSKTYYMHVSRSI